MGGESKSWWKSKTLWTNVGAVIGAAGLAAVSTITPTTAVGVAGLAALNVVLRAITGQPLGK
ncbi:hypothetical protein JCM15519_07160 [Fundidesulfovibrio butyratiphilus]